MDELKELFNDEFIEIGCKLDDIMTSMVMQNVIESTTFIEEPFSGKNFAVRFRLLDKK